MTQQATIPEDLAALPLGTVILDAQGEVFRSSYSHGYGLHVWWHAGDTTLNPEPALPATVIMDGAARETS